MIDTVEYKANAILDKTTLHKMQVSSGQNVIYAKPGGQNSTSYSYRLYGDKRMPRLKYTVESGILTVTIPSMGYYMFGSSIRHFSGAHLNLFYTKILQEIKAELNITKIDHPSKWSIVSMDVYFDFNVGTQLKEYIYALKQHLFIDERYKQHSVADETVSWRCDSKELRFYDKYQKAQDTGEDNYTINNSRGILRFECGIKKPELKRKFKSATVKDVVTDRNVRKLLTEHLNMLGKWNGNITNEIELYETISKHVKSETKIGSILWYIRAKSLGLNINLSRGTKQGYEKVLKRIGVLPVIANKYLPPLKIERSIVKKVIDSTAILYFNNTNDSQSLLNKVTLPNKKYSFI